MKTITKITLFTFMLFISIQSKATIRTVNNSPTSPGQFNSVSAAISAANSGDSIYICGSSTNYGAFTVNKRLTIIGTGHNPQKQAPLVSLVDQVYITSSGVRIIGLNCYTVEANSGNVDSVYIERNYFRYRLTINQSNCDHWYIQGNVFGYSDDNIYFCSTCGSSYIYAYNNVFNGRLNELDYNGYNTNIYIMNNLFLRNGDAFSGSNYYLYIYNNTFYRANPSPSTTGCTWGGNTSYQCSNNAFPSGTNKTNVNPSFINFPNGGAYFDYSYNFNLQDTSQLKNAGTDGTDIGITGGIGYYEQNGIPNIPQIREFNITSSRTIAPGGTLNINIKSTIKR
ncbi:MAG: hypothetical protein HYZ42_06290 [Bacteroidetes bacterium]|nr:hypothetical protein [Bacteroidota bacterium]